ncbi:MAG: hypothetical protein WD398_06665 [Cyclobacteriaceae bacterium]
MINHLLGFYLFCQFALFYPAQWKDHFQKYVAYKTVEKPMIDRIGKS